VEEINNSPDFLTDVKWHKVTKILFEVTARNKSNTSKKIAIEIEPGSSYGAGTILSIEGDNEEWTRSTKTELEEILNDLNDVNILTRYRWFISLAASSLFSYLLYSSIYRFDINDLVYNLLHWFNNDFFKIILIVTNFVIWYYIYKIMTKAFPNLVITDNYSPYSNNIIKIISFFFLAALGNAFYDLVIILIKK